jgi:hypothetical protein
LRLDTPRNAATTVIDEIEAERHALTLEDRISADDREQLRALGVFDGLAADAINAVVTLFEIYAREEFSRRLSNPAAIVSATSGNVFQRLGDADTLFAAHAGFALNSLVPSDVWTRLRRTFEQRHVLTHRGGHVDQRYLRRVPGSSLMVGQRLVISRAEAAQALDDLEQLVKAMEAK